MRSLQYEGPIMSELPVVGDSIEQAKVAVQSLNDKERENERLRTALQQISNMPYWNGVRMKTIAKEVLKDN